MIDIKVKYSTTKKLERAFNIGAGLFLCLSVIYMVVVFIYG